MDSMCFCFFPDIVSEDSEAEGDGNLDSSEAELEDSEPEEDYESESDEEEHNENAEGNTPIYPGAPISLHESLLAIFTLASAEHVTAKLLSGILRLIALHCPDGSAVKRTLKAFRSYFKKIADAFLIYHFFCGNCIFPLQSKNSVCKKCKKRGNAAFFLELPLLQQLQTLFKRAGFYEDLQYRFQPDRKLNSENIEDIYDGRIYQEQAEFFSSPNNISFTWYSDGIKIFKSSSFSIWPLCLVINELAYKKRILPHNILLVGLWFGKSKPNPNVFLRPFRKNLNSFEKDGHKFKLQDGTEVLVKGKVICGTCDLPAKAKFLKFKQYNGEFGCSRCLQSGGRAAAGNTTVQVYPYVPNVRERSHDETQDFAREALAARATDRKASVNGVKGPTLLSKIVPDIIRCTAIDIMHGVFLGVCKMLLDLWFNSKYSRMPWSLHHLEHVVDEKIKKLKPPSNVQRAPRSLKDLKFWKAAEYKLFMLYYSVIVLKDVMEDVYLKHHCLLVSAICLLSQDSISLGQINAAGNLLRSYVADFARLYASSSICSTGSGTIVGLQLFLFGKFQWKYKQTLSWDSAYCAADLLSC